MNRYVKATYFWVTAFVATFFLYVWCILARLWILATGRPQDGRLHHHIATVWGRTMIALVPGWKVTVTGREHVPQADQAMVIVANHESMSDIWAMYYVGLPFRWLSKEEVFRKIMVGRAMKWAGYVPIRRGSPESHAEAMRRAAELLRQGIPMFFFPEGTRSKDGTIQPFKLGAFKLARDGGTPMLPIAIHGAGGLLRKGSMVPSRTAHVRIRILPLVPPPAPDGDLDAYAAAMRTRIAAAHAELV